MTSEIVIPLSNRVLIRRDDEKKQTKGGIVLPDKASIPTITGRVVEISEDINNGAIKKYDRVLVNPGRGIPIEIDSNNKLFVVPYEDIVAVFKKVGIPEIEGDNCDANA